MGLIDHKFEDNFITIANRTVLEQMAAAVSEGILRYRDVLKERQLTLAVTDPRPE